MSKKVLVIGTSLRNNSRGCKGRRQRCDTGYTQGQKACVLRWLSGVSEAWCVCDQG